MNNADVLYRALQRQCDDRGFIRITLDELALTTGLSRSTVQRALSELVASGQIRRRSKDGRSGGLLIRLETCSKPGQETCSKPVQTDQVDHVFTQTPGPEGALGGLLSASQTCSPSTSGRDFAYRTTTRHEVPASGAELIYAGPDGDGKWRRLTATLWEAPNGDAVSVRSMTPELRQRLRVDENDDGTRNLEAIRAIRGIVE